MNSDQHSISISRNLKNITEAIHEAARRSGRNPNEIQLVAATKTVAVDRMREAHTVGVQIFGENRLQEAQKKQEALSNITDVSWHFIGQVQRRKIKEVVGKFDVIHSVETLAQANAMNDRARDLGIVQDVLLQVNVSGETSKGGYTVPDLMKVLPELDILEHLHVKGLMTIPPLAENTESARPYFRRLRELADTIKQVSYQRIGMDDLSMGMSQDYRIAVEEGATLVRVGTALFGVRSPVR